MYIEKNIDEGITYDGTNFAVAKINIKELKILVITYLYFVFCFGLDKCDNSILLTIFFEWQC